MSTERPLRGPPPRTQLALAALGPGGLAGTLVALLIFFLNLELPFTPASVLRAAGAYGALLAAGSLLLHAPWIWGRRRGFRFLPWSLTAVLLGGAVLTAGQASWYAFYLPPAINNRLLEAALWIGLLGLAALFTALAHTLPKRRHGPRSRWGLGVMALAALLVMIDRRSSFRPPPEPVPPRSVVEGSVRLSLLVVGVDAASLDAILPLAEQGRLPFLGGVLARGSYARLRSFTPMRVSPVWASLATGKRPHRHGVRSERLYPVELIAEGARLRLLPAGIAFRRWALPQRTRVAIGRGERKARTLWEILAGLGVRTGMVGWPDSAAPSPAMAFSLPAAFFAGEGATGWPPGVAQRAEGLRGVVAADGEVAAALGVGAPAGAAAALQGDLWREAVALDMLSRTPAPEALFVRLPGLAEVSRRWFGGYVAHDLEGVSGERVGRSAQVVADYYRHVDDALAELWARRRGPRLLVLVSPHGAAAPGPWRRAALLGRQPVEGVLTGRADGVLLLHGEGVRAGAFVADATVEDVVPTLLYALGLPLARDLDGRALTAAFDPGFLATHPLRFVASYERLSR